MSNSEFEDALRASALEFRVSLTEEQVVLLEKHFDLLCTWNRKMNLTRIDDPREAALRHYLESMALSPLIGDSIKRVVDVGSGPGFPGIPLAIVRPDLDFVLVDANVRRTVFLKEAVRLLGLQKAKVVAGLFDTAMVRPADCLVARAVERFSEVVPTFLVSAAAQMLLLAGEGLLTDVPPEVLDTWTVSRIPVPYSSSRLIYDLTRSTP